MPNGIVLSEILKTALVKCYVELKNLAPTLTKWILCDKVARIFSVSYVSAFKLINNFEKGIAINKAEDAKTPGRKPSKYYDDYCFKEDLSQKIWKLHQNGEIFNLEKLLEFSKKELEFQGSQSTLRKIIISMGFKYKKCNNRYILMEQEHLQVRKIAFLRKCLQYLESNEKINFIFLDETWIYRNGSQIRMWVHEKELKGNPRKIKNEGKRFTVLHAGCSAGFLDGCNLILDNKIEYKDYHQNMNDEIFKKWVEDQLLPALNAMDGKCVVVMDNAPYHSMIVDMPPTSNSRKSEIEEWLKRNGVDFAHGNTRKQLWDIIKSVLANQNYSKKYVIDTLLNAYGHDVLRLPPYHCQYNPIEMVWGFCKIHYNKNINSWPLSKDRVMNLWQEALSKFNGEMWQNSINHCEKIIKNDWLKYMGNCSVKDIPPIIISLGQSDSESDTESKLDSSEEMQIDDDVFD